MNTPCAPNTHLASIKGLLIAIQLRFGFYSASIRLRFDYRFDCVNESAHRHSVLGLLKTVFFRDVGLQK